ncbi:MAG: PKD domain-containing protein [Bacteroidota bacterium]|nr:PKD domain-containing protein [Bacteroidota bacterium]
MKYLFTLSFFCITVFSTAQSISKISPAAGETNPAWAIRMYSEHPNIWQVDDEYRAWRKSNPTAKTTYTQYYKKWRRDVTPYIDQEGFEKRPSADEFSAFQQRLENLKNSTHDLNVNRQGGNWSVLGPVETFNTNTGPSPLAKSSQSNIYCIDQSLSNPDIVYCGTEGSEIYKSIDRGQTWSCVSREINISAVTALEVHPTNPDIVYAGEHSRIHRSVDGGINWSLIMEEPEAYPNEILVNPAHDTIVLAATQAGLYRSNDAGDTWTRILEFPCYDIEWKSDDPQVVFLVRNDPAAGICRFYKSSDAGLTWTVKNEGWFFSDLEGRYDGGARLAVTKADPNRVYAVLIGEAKTDDSGFIGIYRSDDAGETWSLPNPPAGGPWDETNHPNMATIGRTGGYHQGYYNLGFDVSDSNPDFVMAGFLNLWYSIDGAATFTCFGGYCGNDFNYVHPDCQEIEMNANDIWMTSDGGIEYSNDFFATHYAHNRGITGSDYWGFGTGWNEDILVGGRYHNGNSGWHENWMPGEVLSLGGGEAASGYVNPAEGRITYFSDIGGVVLPASQNGYAEYFSIGKYPNESYYDAESGEMEWDPISWNTYCVTNENKIWKTTDGGATFSILHEFGTDVNAKAMSFEISRSNPNVMYLFQRDEYSWDPGLLWKTLDGGESWNEITLPPGYARRVLVALSAEDEDRVWVAYTDGNDGEKIYTSMNGGTEWENLTTPALNGEHISYILHQGGTDGGLYLGTFRTIWYRDDTISEWMTYQDGLPVQIATCILRPYYKEHKIRLAAYGKGIWEAPFAVPSRPVAQPMVNKRITSCPGDTIRYDDFSMLSHADATWEWTFNGGVPSASDIRNPKVVYPYPGLHDVTLKVTNPYGSSTKTIIGMIEALDPEVGEIPPFIDFDLDDEYFTINNPDEGITWTPVRLTTCDTEGDTAYVVDNYNYSSYGRDEIILPYNMDLTQVQNPTLYFKVAYAPYFDGNFFIDSLKVLLSNNCGTTYKTIFRSGGVELSTTSSGEGPGSLYEYQPFSPQSCEEWRLVELDLSEYAGQYITIKFLNQSGYGNNMYLDDIFMESTLVGTHEEKIKQKISLHPNPATSQVTIKGDDSFEGKMDMTLFSSEGIIVLKKEMNPTGRSWKECIRLENLPNGIYFAELKTAKGNMQVEKLVISGH